MPVLTRRISAAGPTGSGYCPRGHLWERGSDVEWDNWRGKSPYCGKPGRWLMAWFVRDKERDRFYLLPGMGGRALRRKRKLILQWSIVAGLFASALVAWI